jgi:hypothetical protein
MEEDSCWYFDLLGRKENLKTMLSYISMKKTRIKEDYWKILQLHESHVLESSYQQLLSEFP